MSENVGFLLLTKISTGTFPLKSFDEAFKIVL
jgi:hypothetical protein